MIQVDPRKATALLATMAAAILFAPHSYGQSVAVAEVGGVVVDATGAGVPNAQVKATQTGTQINRVAVTDPTGRYTLPNLPIGPYTLEVTASGFKSFLQTGIILQVGQNVQVNVTLQVGALTEHVEVNASAGMVETKDNTISGVMDGERILDLPLNGRQATDLILALGAAVTGPAGDMSGSKNFYSSTTISVAGGQVNGTNYLLDGGDHNDTFSNVNLPFPFPDALQEFSVETSTLPARNGMHPGGVVNVVTKSGSNEWHGDLFEFLRNGDLNARNYFAATHDSLKRNQYGGTFGGKIIANKLFFFGGYQGTRLRQNPPSTTSYVPTTAMLAGDFNTFDGAGCVSSGRKQLIDPTNKQPFANNQIPIASFNQASLNLVKYLPTDQVQNGCGKVVYGIPNISNEAQYVGRVDYVRGSKHTIFARYFDIDYVNPPNWDPKDILVTVNPGNDERAQTITIGDTYTFGPTKVNSFHASFTRRRDNRGPNSQDINVKQLGVALNPYVGNDMRIVTSNYFNVGCGTCAPGFFNVNSFQFADDFDWIHGKHQIAFGVNFVRTQNNTQSGYLQNGTFTFGGIGYTGDAMADFLLGYLSTNGTSYAFAQSKAQEVALRESIPGLYIQDTYRLNQRITINAGLRWEPMLFPQDTFGRGSVFSMDGFISGQKSSVFKNAPAGSTYYGDPGVPKAFTADRMGNFAPRLGLVWNPRGDGKQTFRVGGALLYDSGMVWFSQRLMSNPPFVNEIDLTTAGPFNNPWLGYPGGNPFPIPVPPPSNVAFPTSAAYYVLPPNLKSMYMTQWNASYQRQFANNWMASISYLGNKTTHLWLSRDLNYSVYIPGQSSTSNTAARRVLTLINPAQGQYYGTVYIADDGGNSNYNAMLLTVRHNFSQGYTALANYTWGHCIGEGDFNGDLRGAYYQDPTNRHADRADCNYDYRQIFNASIVAESPFREANWTGRILGHWQLSPAVRLVSGSPLTITSGKDNSLTGEGLDRVNLASGVSPYNSSLGPQLQYFNPAAFTANPAGTFGNLGRDVLRGPGLVSVNVALVRNFHVNERWRLESRFEAFNVINHTNFGSPATNFTSATLGRITATAGGTAGDPRILQFALKLHF